MLKELFAYSAVRTKTAAMRAAHLSEAQYRELCQKPTVTDAVAYLKNNTVYASLLKDVNERTLHRGDLERMLDGYLQAEVQKLYRFCDENEKKILSYTYIRYEIRILKQILRAVYAGHPAEIIYEKDGFFAKKLSFDPAAAAQAQSPRELLELIRGTPYYAVLQPVLTAGADLFIVESALDIYYFKTVWRMKDKALQGKDKHIVEESFGSEIDMKNLCWIYRQKKYYQIPGELIFSTIIPIHYKIPREFLIRLVNTPDVDAFVELARTTRYVPLFDGLEERFIEQNFDRMVEKLITRLLQNNPFSIAVLTGYTHFLEREIAKIITAVESIRYGANG